MQAGVFSLLLLVDGINECGGGLERLEFRDGGGFSSGNADLVLLKLLSHSSSEGSSEDIFILLLWEVHIIISVWMRVLSWVVSVILPSGVSSKIFGVAVTPVLDLEVRHGFSLVVVGNGHGSLVSLVINSLGSEEPLSLLSETLKNVVWANLHNGNLFVEASILSGGR